MQMGNNNFGNRLQLISFRDGSVYNANALLSVCIAEEPKEGTLFKVHDVVAFEFMNGDVKTYEFNADRDVKFALNCVRNRLERGENIDFSSIREDVKEMQTPVKWEEIPPVEEFIKENETEEWVDEK